MKKVVYLIMIATVLFSCGGKNALKGIKVSPSTLKLMPGDQGMLTVLPDPSEADFTKANVKWVSNDESVATVSNSGLVTAIAGGDAVITAKYDNFTATCNVHVAGYWELVEFSTVVLLQWDLGDLISADPPRQSTSDPTKTYIDSLFLVSMFALSNDVSWASGTGIVGSGGALYISVPMIYQTVTATATGAVTGHAWTFLAPQYVASDDVITTVAGLWAYGPDPNTVDVVPFAKGAFDLNAFNNAYHTDPNSAKMGDYISGTEVLIADGGHLYYGGVVSDGSFKVQWGQNDEYASFKDYNFTGSIIDIDTVTNQWFIDSYNWLPSSPSAQISAKTIVKPASINFKHLSKSTLIDDKNLRNKKVFAIKKLK